MTVHATHPQTPAGRANPGIAAAAPRSAAFMEALIAAGVLLAYADGEMAAAERRRLLQLVRENAALAAFPQRRIVDDLAEHEANFQFDPEVAQVLAREKLAPMVGEAHLCRLILDACRQIVPADGVVHPAEARVLAELADCLGIEAMPHGSAAS